MWCIACLAKLIQWSVFIRLFISSSRCTLGSLLLPLLIAIWHGMSTPTIRLQQSIANKIKWWYFLLNTIRNNVVFGRNESYPNNVKVSLNDEFLFLFWFLSVPDYSVIFLVIPGKFRIRNKIPLKQRRQYKKRGSVETVLQETTVFSEIINEFVIKTS